MQFILIFLVKIGRHHTFLGITDGAGNAIYKGFGPSEHGLIKAGNGIVSYEYNYDKNEMHEWQHKIEFNISQKQYDDLINNIEKSSKNSPKYHLPSGAQCTVWAMDMLY